jgi:hypothetical protein
MMPYLSMIQTLKTSPRNLDNIILQSRIEPQTIPFPPNTEESFTPQAIAG